MRTFYSLSRIGLLAGILAGSAGGASAQSETQVIRGDVAATIGWLSTDAHTTGLYNDNNWVNSLFGAASAGWHWTDNLKTEADFGGGTESRAFRPEQVVIDGRATFYTVESRFSRRTLGISQQYQFFHNVWFHPHVAAGVNVSWERRRDEPGPIYLYDATRQQSRIVPPVEPEKTQTSLRANPFLAVGYKAYVTDRAFFRNDFRIAFRGGVEETVLRFGFGFDF